MWALPELAHDECGQPEGVRTVADLRRELVHGRPDGRPFADHRHAGRNSAAVRAASLCSRRLASPDARKQVYRDSGLKVEAGGIEPPSEPENPDTLSDLTSPGVRILSLPDQPYCREWS